MVTHIKPSTLLLIFVTTSVAAQTFQYSRGWVNGKRDGREGREGRDGRDGREGRKYDKELADTLAKIISPCQLQKLRYILEGRPANERLYVPCDYSQTADDEENLPKRYKSDHQEPPFEAFL